MGFPITIKETLGLSAQLLLQRPERVAEAWQSARCVEEGGEPQERILEGVIVSFLREIGAQLAGARGSPWERTTGVLKLCAKEGTAPIYSELGTLRYVIDSALDVLKASLGERMIADGAIDEALASAVLAHQQLRHPERPAQDLHFGGVVVERFRPFAWRRAQEESDLDVEWEPSTEPGGLASAA